MHFQKNSREPGEPGDKGNQEERQDLYRAAYCINGTLLSWSFFISFKIVPDLSPPRFLGATTIFIELSSTN